MKKYLKLFFISLTSLFLVAVIFIIIAFWLVFTPERLTPVVRKQSEKYIPYRTDIGEVELTLFSTFPQLGLKVNDFAVFSPGTDAPCDTLVFTKELVGVIDARAYWKSGELIINKFILSEGLMNVYTDSLGQTNYGLLVDGPVNGSEESSGVDAVLIDLENIEFDKLNISYIDLLSGLNTSINNLSAQLAGNIRGDSVKFHLNLSDANVSFEYEGEKYLDNAGLKLNIPGEILLSRQLIQLNDAYASINDLGITVRGNIENDTLFKNIITGINYRLDSWQIKDIMALVPPKYLKDFHTFDASGIISSTGSIKGIANDSLMPQADIKLKLNEGYIKYDGLPFPLTEMDGNIHIFSDLNNDTVSWLQISSFEAKTPGSGFKTRGKVDHLYHDMHINLITEADVLVDEFKSFIPGNVDLSIGGRISGLVRSDFTMSQATGMELDKMKLSGSASLSDFSLVYDTISLSSPKAEIDFSIPNPGISERNTNFAFIKIASENLTSAKIGDIGTSMRNTHFFMEMSDLRDSTVIPDLFCTFSIDSLWAGMDTISISINKPYGYFSVSPSSEMPANPAIQLAYTSYDMTANAGDSFVSLDDISIKTDIINDNSQNDIFLQWLATGSAGMNNGVISLPELSHPIEISAIKMDFDPENFNVHEGNIVIDQSDFGLTGTLKNVLSYFRGDSILMGDFNFVSSNTDLARLMYLTSGIGVEGEDNIQKGENVEHDPSQANNNGASEGPYMVPQGIDVMLRANVEQATMGSDTATNIIGNVRVSDGLLVMDELTFTTPAADMQLTAMYRTPRKNHLYLGLDYHMLDVEISRLLEMIPDIDTLMPMLRSFEGSGEFHIAVETYLDSLYNIKKSTLRGASSIRGEDLVLMDGETFSEISKSLRFRNRDENRVDSLSSEFTIFREEIDVYPFLMVMDRYKAIIGGRHNFDLSFDYHITVVESPLPFRLGIDINGTVEELKYRMASPRYSELYRPVSRRAVESRQLELRRMIREALLQNVREQSESTKDNL